MRSVFAGPTIIACACLFAWNASTADTVDAFKPGSVEEQHNEVPPPETPLVTIFKDLEANEAAEKEGALLWLLRLNKATELSYFAFPKHSIRFSIERLLKKEVDGILWRLVECRYVSRQAELSGGAEYRAVWNVAYLFDDLGHLRDWAEDYDVLFLDDLNGDGHIELFTYIDSPKRAIMYSHERGRSREVLRVDEVPEGSDAIRVVLGAEAPPHKVAVAAWGVYKWDEQTQRYVKSDS